MIKRIIDISKQSYLFTEQRQLLIKQDSEIVGRIPIEDIGVLILQHQAIVLSQALVIACQKNNVALVFCDERHLPYSLVLPLSEGNRLHQKVLKNQIEAHKGTRNRIWKQVVSVKILNQSRVLKYANKEFRHLESLSRRVKSGDSANHEAQAAQKYWPLLFGKTFRRDKSADGINSLLNYGYAVVRAIIARAIVASGLHPALGINHHNQYNGLCLADDLMEPFRPWVDHVVLQIVKIDSNACINRQTKQRLLSIPFVSVCYNNRTMPFMVASHYLLADFKRALNGEIKNLIYPERTLDHSS